MVVYQLTFMDMEKGKIVQWKRNKREVARFINNWRKRYPLRTLMLREKIIIPDDKQGFVDWLNKNCGGLDGLP